MNAPTNTAVAKRDDNPMVQFKGQLEQRAAQFKSVLPSHITVEQFQRTILTAVQSEPDLLKASRSSLMLACMKAAQDKLLPDKRESALVIFNNRVKDDQGRWETVKEVVYMPMVYGLRKKILQSGEVVDITTAVVYRQEVESGRFIYEEGTERMLRHKPDLDPDFNPSDDDIAAAYSVATFKDGSKSFEVMRRSEINKVRETSKTGATLDRQGKPRQPSGPWVDWFSEMCRKTVMRRHAKSLPMSGDIIDIEARDDEDFARSTVSALAMGEPDARTVIEDNSARLPSVEELEQGYDEDTGEIIEHDEPAHDDTPPQTDARGNVEKPDWEELCDEIIDRAVKAQTVIDLKNIEADWKKRSADRGAWPDAGLDMADTVDREIASAKKRLGQG